MSISHGSTASVGVVGGSGYTGRELLRRLAVHPGAYTRFALSRSEEGASTAVAGLRYTQMEPGELPAVDVLFLCLPHGRTSPWVEAARAQGSRVVDLTADHRPGSGREAHATYGLAEWSDVRNAALVANPGCYPTGVLTALKPLAAADLLAEGVITVQAASGVSGAGRSPKKELLFGEVSGDFRAYGLGNGHRHLLEMKDGLPGRPLLFVPHLLPVERGILETLTVPVAHGVDAEVVRRVWRERYEASPVVRVSDTAPTLREVTRSDLLILSAFDNADLPGLLTLVVAFDNLGKGAAGQAIQNFNAMAGMPAEWGLQCAAS